MGFKLTEEGQVKEALMLSVGVFGKANIGKTQLLHRINGLAYTRYDYPTIGVDFSSLSNESSNTTSTLRLWDTSGDKRFKAIVSSYYRQCNIAIYCVDLSTKIDSKHIKQTITDIKKQSDATVIFVGTKADLCDEAQQAAARTTLQHIAPDVPIFITSAKANFGIDELSKELFSQTCPFSDAYQAAKLKLLDSLSHLKQDKKKEMCDYLNELELSFSDPKQPDKIAAIDTFKTNAEAILKDESIILKSALVLVKVLLVASTIILAAAIGFGIGFAAGIWAGPGALLTGLLAGHAAAVSVAAAAGVSGVVSAIGLNSYGLFKEPETQTTSGTEVKDLAEAAINPFKTDSKT